MEIVPTIIEARKPVSQCRRVHGINGSNHHTVGARKPVSQCRRAHDENDSNHHKSKETSQPRLEERMMVWKGGIRSWKGRMRKKRKGGLGGRDGLGVRKGRMRKKKKYMMEWYGSIRS